MIVDLSTRHHLADMLRLVTSLFVVASLFGCSGDQPTVTSPDAASQQALYDLYELPRPEPDPILDDLALRLRALMNVFSFGQGMSFFRMPESDDYANIPQDPLNPLTAAKVELGKLLFHETGLAVNNVRPEGETTYACSTCHPSASSFFPGIPQAIGEGGSGFGSFGEGRVLLPQYDSNPDQPDLQLVRAPASLNMAFFTLAMRDGRLGGVGANLGVSGQWNAADGSDNNALGHHGIETQAFVGLSQHRMGDIDSSFVASDPTYQAMFAAAFPSNPVVSRYNAAMAIAAYERTIMANQSPFQRYLRGHRYAMTVNQARGAIIFFEAAGCIQCHSGKALGSNSFFAVGMNDIDESADPGRVDLSPWGGAFPDSVRLGRARFSGFFFEEYQWKVPQLYNLKDSNFYGHGSSFSSVREVVEYYNTGVKQNSHVPQGKIFPLFKPLGLTPEKMDYLTEFLEDALYDPYLARYVPTSTPSGYCFPSNDPQAQLDLGCSPASLPPPDMRRRSISSLFRGRR